MIQPTSILFIHGSGGDRSQTYKARFLQGIFPGMLIPDFDGDLSTRMTSLEHILRNKDEWTLIGSSLGGLLATLYAIRHPDQVRKLILLAPALTLPDFLEHIPKSIDIPTVVIQGSLDDVIPPDEIHKLSKRVFTHLKYLIVDDDHRLHKTCEKLDWVSLIK